ncbi:MAG: hypothetical protein J6M62_05605 [Selenomonadaceae bacterium]|nr:hypothetical protein [Selenomonadaceae bacterium]MBP3722410.1 hypothetical protein [Selenomonadaceae bacterium]
MATVNATLSNFFGVAELASRGIGSGETRSHPAIPTFMQDVGKIQGVNYAKSFSESVMGKGGLTNAVNNYSEEKDSFKTEFKNAMDKAKKTAGGLNNLDYGQEKKSPLNTLSQHPIGFKDLNKSANAEKMQDDSKTDTSKSLLKQKDTLLDDVEKENKEETELVNESRITPPFQAEIEDNVPKKDDTAIGANPATSDITPRATDAISFDASKTAGAVSNMMEEYNDTVGFLQSKIGTSENFDHFASSFAANSELTDDMDKIGVQVEPATGMVSVDTKTLTDAIEDSPDNVKNILGKNGFGGAIEKSSEAGNFGASKMFPSITDAFLDKHENLKGMYSQMRQVTSTPRGNLGNLMDTNY